MPGIPKKALREDKLKIIKDEKAGDKPDGSHDTSRVSWIDGDNRIQHGFYKRLDPEGHFPELLAKISVAVSVILGLIHNRAAKEFLVYDAKDKIVGLVSLGIKDFKSFNFSGEIPKSSAEKEVTIPTTKKLIETNMVELLFARWALGDDDAHPHNLSLFGHIDYDMFLYWFVVYMKGGRPGIALPKKRIELTPRDYASFPCINDLKSYHWATYDHPGQKSIKIPVPEAVQTTVLSATLPKGYADPKQFAALATDPKAQEQKVSAALKALLTFQPELLRKRLIEHFGDEPLNYKKLRPELREKYEALFPKLCNETTNKASFVDFMMTVYQLEHFDSLYRATVFFPGCADNGFGAFKGIPLLSTHEELYRKPSYYQNIVAWVKKQNETLDKENQYSLEDLKKRYHQVWRDANTKRIQELLEDARALTNKMSKLAAQETEVEKEGAKKEATVEKPITKDVMDTSITSSWQLLEPLNEISIGSQIQVPKTSPLYNAYSALTAFTNKLQHLTEAYYSKERVELTLEDNQIFTEGLEDLCRQYGAVIKEHLSHVTTYAATFANIVREMKLYAQQIDFRMHLASSDAEMSKVEHAAPAKKPLVRLTDPSTITQFNTALFQWVKSLSPGSFNKHVEDIIDEDYGESWSRARGPGVKKYLKAGTAESNDNKLGYILCSGNEDGELNKALIKGLASRMSQTHHIQGVSMAIQDGSFTTHAPTFVKAAVQFAKMSDGMTHLYSEKGIYLVFKTLYQWVDQAPERRFTRVKDEALKTYKDNLSVTKKGLTSLTGLLSLGLLGGPDTDADRVSEINRYFRDYIPSKALAHTFNNGTAGSTASKYMLLSIIREMKKDIQAKPELKKEPGYALIDVFVEKDHEDFYLKQIKCTVTQALLPPVRVVKAAPEKAAPAKAPETAAAVELDDNFSAFDAVDMGI